MPNVYLQQEEAINVALLDRMAGVGAAELQWVRNTDERLSDQRLQVPPESYEDFGVTANVVRSVRSRRTPPLGVYAAGLTQFGTSSWRPALIVMVELLPRTGVAVQEDRFRGIVDLAGNGDIDPRDVAVIGIARPLEYYRSVRADMEGTLGLPVRNSTGGNAVLTAGHVARTVGAIADLGNGLSGTISYSNNRWVHASAVPCADVGVIDVPTSWRNSVHIPYLRGLSTPSIGMRVRAHGRNGTTATGTVIRTVGDRFFMEENQGAWGDFAFCDALSSPGDSGALVVSDDDLVVGQVVAGRPGAYSIFQDIEYLLNDSGTTPDIA